MNVRFYVRKEFFNVNDITGWSKIIYKDWFNERQLFIKGTMTRYTDS